MNSGVYNYFLNGEPTGVIETFEVKILPDGSKFTKSFRDAKPYNTTITVEAIEKNGRFQTTKIRFTKNKTTVDSTYEFEEKTFRIVRNWNKKTIQDESFELTETAIFFPLMRCFQGQTILQVAANQSVTPVVMPNIINPNDLYLLLQPSFDQRTAKLMAEHNNLRVFNYLTKHYDDNSEFHIDKNGLLVYYKFVQNESQSWEVILTP